jgi:two-component system, chemotaxis family, sensor kinase CheA
MMDTVWLCEVPEKNRREIYTELAEAGTPAWLVCYTPAADAVACGQDPLRLVRDLPGIRWFDLDARSVVPDSPDSGPNVCRLMVKMIVVAIDPTKFENLAAEGDRVLVTGMTPYDLCFPTGEPQPEGWQGVEPEMQDLLKHKQGLALWRVIAAKSKETEESTWQAAVLRWMSCVLESARPDQALLEALLASLSTGCYQPPVATPPATEALSRNESPETAALRGHAALLVQAQIALLCPVSPDPAWPGRLYAAATALERVFRSVGEAELAAKIPEAVAAALQASSAGPLQNLAEEALHTWHPETVNLLTKMGSCEPKPVAASPIPAPARTEEVEHQALRMLKVEPGRIDALLGLVGELAVAKNALPFLARKAELDFGSRQMAREIKERYAVINRITEELQSAVMHVRMMPLAHVFRRFPRLVRDLSAKLGKLIRLEILGEETEADKSIVEELFDPLVHLFRNSIDHGVEMPDEREAAGKAREGLIRLSAQHADDSVIIEIRDDGHGINVERVRKKAIEKNLASPEDLRQRSDEEIIQLIFAPGFSTAENVSELSGRGVGMDVVRTMVTRAGGTITVTSKPQEGTITRITLPVTMAVSRVMIVETGGTEVGLPFANVTETVRVEQGDLKHVGQDRAIVLRGRMIPVWPLAELLALPKTETLAEEGISVLVLRVDGHDLGLAVDGFQETVDVITKPLAGVLERLELFSGTAMLGDGRVLLVLDPKEVVRCL